MGTKEVLKLSDIVEETIESLNISAEEKEIMYDFILIEKNNRDKASKFYKDKYQERIKEFTEKKK
tara:strand:- start:311 stop:505 length:195 start_codon:yes stop_codon:yes gene_type:complete